jgi:hypothetical protein
MSTTDASKYLPKLSFFCITFYADRTIYSDNFGDKITSSTDYYLGSLNYPVLSRHHMNGIRAKNAAGFNLNASTSVKSVEMLFTPLTLAANTLFYASSPSATRLAWNGSGVVSKANIAKIYVNNIDVTNQRFLLMNLYLNVIFKTLLSNNARKQKYDKSKIQNKPPFVPLVIQEKYMISPPQFYELEQFPKIKYNDVDVIRKLNDVNLETKINENDFIGAGTINRMKLKDNTRIKNKKNNFLIKLKYIKTKKHKTIKKKIRNIKHKNELKHEINTKIKKYIKKYLKKKEKQLEVLESQITNATNTYRTNRTNRYNFSFNKQENKSKIKKILNSNINNKINKFNKHKTKYNNNNKNNTRKNYN